MKFTFRLTDRSGTMVYRGEYDPYGNLVYEWGSAGLNPRKFTGYERDATGLDYANARMYGPGRRRFMQPDPLGLGGANRANPQSLNRYSYVQNDPVNFSDPTGNLLAAPDGPGFDSPCQSGIGTLGGALTGVTMTLAREGGTGWSFVLVWGGLSGCYTSRNNNFHELPESEQISTCTLTLGSRGLDYPGLRSILHHMFITTQTWSTDPVKDQHIPTVFQGTHEDEYLRVRRNSFQAGNEDYDNSRNEGAIFVSIEFAGTCDDVNASLSATMYKINNANINL